MDKVPEPVAAPTLPQFSVAVDVLLLSVWLELSAKADASPDTSNVAPPAIMRRGLFEMEPEPLKASTPLATVVSPVKMFLPFKVAAPPLTRRLPWPLMLEAGVKVSTPPRFKVAPEATLTGPLSRFVPSHK